MNIGIAVPVKRGSKRGNEITALRWQKILQELGHQTVVFTTHDSLPPVDCLIAVHAVRSHDLVCRYRNEFPDKPLIVCLSGTDLHGVFDQAEETPTPSLSDEIKNRAVQSLELADIILLLEPEGQKKLPQNLQSKCRVVFQSADPWIEETKTPNKQDEEYFQVSLIGHLRSQKDPMLAARATRLLSDRSRIKLVHVGAILEPHYEPMVQAELKENPRYRWLGKLSHDQTLRVLVESDVTVLTSRQEGAPSLVSEAIVNCVPLLVTRIDGTLGMLGKDYPGFFEVGDEVKLAHLLEQAENDPNFLEELKSALRIRQDLFTRSSELNAWKDLLAFFGPK